MVDLVIDIACIYGDGTLVSGVESAGRFVSRVDPTWLCFVLPPKVEHGS